MEKGVGFQIHERCPFATHYAENESDEGTTKIWVSYARN